MKIFFLTLLSINSFLLFAQSHNPQYRIIVYDFKKNGGDFLKNAETIIPNSIISNLISIANKEFPELSILERKEIVKLYKDKSDAEKLPRIFDISSAITLGKMLQANYSIFGEISQSELFDGIRISARCVNISTGVIVSAVEFSKGSKENYQQIVEDIAKNIINDINPRKQLGQIIDEEPNRIISKTFYNFEATKHRNIAFSGCFKNTVKEYFIAPDSGYEMIIGEESQNCKPKRVGNYKGCDYTCTKLDWLNRDITGYKIAIIAGTKYGIGVNCKYNCSITVKERKKEVK